MCENRQTGIIGTGIYIPLKKVTNRDLVSQGLNTTEEWIISHTGISQRFIASENETASYMASIASKEALRKANILPSELDLIIACTWSGDYLFPAVACRIQNLINATNAGAFDLNANCGGFIYGLSMANSQIVTDSCIRNVLVIGVEVMSPYIDWKDRNSCIYFGDGAGAVILSRVPSDYGILSSKLYCDGTGFDAVKLRGGGSSYPFHKPNLDSKSFFMEVEGIQVWSYAVNILPKVINSALSKIKMDKQDVDLFIFHQANKLMITAIMDRMKINHNKTFTNVESVGNTSSASIPIALYDALNKGVLKDGMVVVLAAVGAGFTFGATVIRWGGKRE